MTETLSAPPPLPAAPTRLVRTRPRKLAGVCEGLGRYTGTDPLLWRVSAVLLVLFGAVGVVLYVVAWVLLPEEGAPPSPGERLASAVSLAWPFPLLAVVGGVVVLLFAADHPRVLVPVAVFAGLGYLVSSRRAEAGLAPVPPPAEPAVDWSAPSVGPAWPPPPLIAEPVAAWGEPYGPPPGLTPVVHAPHRRRSRLGPLVLSGTALVCGSLLALRGLLGVQAVTLDRVLATALLCLGAGLVLGAVWGRARWLALVGLLVAAGLAPAQLVDGGPLSGGVGERTWVATGSADYRLGVGEAVLDLRELPASPGTVIDVELGMGELTVLVPDEMTVQLDAHVAVGELRLPLGTEEVVGGMHLDGEELIGPPDAVEVTLSAQVGVGSLQVRHG